jgi:hypothetical protein
VAVGLEVLTGSACRRCLQQALPGRKCLQEVGTSSPGQQCASLQERTLCYTQLVVCDGHYAIELTADVNSPEPCLKKGQPGSAGSYYTWVAQVHVSPATAAPCRNAKSTGHVLPGSSAGSCQYITHANHWLCRLHNYMCH